MRSLILRSLDFLMGIEILRIDEPIIPGEREHLVELYREINADMRILRDTEAKTVALFYSFCGFVFAGNLVVLGSASPAVSDLLRIFITIPSVLFVLGFWFAVHSRIAYDHMTYEFLMRHRKSIEKEWFKADFPEKPKHLGDEPSGPGYRKTQELVALTAVGVCAIMLIGIVTKTYPMWTHRYCCQDCRGTSVSVCFRNQKPSQSTEPTPTAVTPAAAQPLRQP